MIMERILSTAKEGFVVDLFATVFTTTGRLNRGLFVKYQVIWLFLNILAGFTVLQVTIYITGDDNLGNLINGVLVYVWVIGGIMITARRLHDLGWDGRFALAVLVPFAGVIMLIYLFGMAGQVGANKYGAEPTEN